MKTKTFEIEVIRTCTVKVTLPEALCTDEMIKEWESGLWELDQGIDSIAMYAGEMAALYPGSDHDGIGKLLTESYQKPDYVKNPFAVVAIVEDDDSEVRVVKQDDWKDAP
jgi:hypothetical protein